MPLLGFNFKNNFFLNIKKKMFYSIVRPKREHHHKRENRERDKNASPNYQLGSPSSASGKKQPTSSTCTSPLASASAGSRSPKSTVTSPAPALPSSSSSASSCSNPCKSSVPAAVDEASLSGYNSGDEHVGQKDAQLTPDEWKKRDESFAKIMSDRGFIIKDMEEDGACLFRAISLQIYGDQDMHEIIRQQTMDYIVG